MLDFPGEMPLNSEGVHGTLRDRSIDVTFGPDGATSLEYEEFWIEHVQTTKLKPISTVLRVIVQSLFMFTLPTQAPESPLT